MSEEQAGYNTNTGDQELYRRLSVPFVTEAARDMAIEDFWGIVTAARVQCALSDVHLIIRTNHIDDEGVEQNGIMSGHLGSSDAALNMLGYGYADALAVHGKFLESLESKGVVTEGDLDSACLSYRHDYGLMSKDEKEKLHHQAREWAKAFGLKDE